MTRFAKAITSALLIMAFVIGGSVLVFAEGESASKAGGSNFVSASEEAENAGIIQPDDRPEFQENGKDWNNMPSYASIQLHYTRTGNSRSIGKSQFVLTPISDNCPMPSGTKNGKKTIKVSQSGIYDFGEMKFTTPDSYEYLVTRVPRSRSEVRFDNSRFKVKVLALNTGKCYVVAYKNGSTKKSAIEYADSVAPKTGDIQIDPIYIGMFICASAAFLLFALARRRERKQSM